MNVVIFIGGPLDEQRMFMRTLPPTYDIAVMRTPIYSLADNAKMADPTEVPYERIRYKLMRVRRRGDMTAAIYEPS